MFTFAKHALLNYGLLLLLLLVSYFIYSQGLTGIFIFDDVPNLAPMGKYASLGFWNDFWIFLLEGHSGPTGRPVSLASFYLNDTQWPSLPFDFIKTNIFIHLLNGALIFWFCFKLSKEFNISKNLQLGFSLLTTTIWLLHPMHTTTVLYIVQRMTELSATFIISGLIFYLYGRSQLYNNHLKGFLLLFVGVGISLVFAILSKENGILLVAYILVIEYFLLQPLKKSQPAYFNYWLVPAVIFPFICLLIYLGLATNPDAFANRDFTLTERLLTQPRILFDYLFHIFIPDMNYVTIFHDDFKASTSFFEPWTTSISIFGLILLSVIAVITRKSRPLIAFAIAWFFAGHLIESTVLPLELYFEHRNYLPVLGIFISMSWYLVLFFKPKKMLIASIASFIILFNTAILFQNTKLWGSPLELGITWFQNHPTSERSRLLYVSVLEASGQPIKAIDKKPLTTNKSQFSTTSLFLELKDACIQETLAENQLNQAINSLKDSIIHISAKTRFLEFISEWKKGSCKTITPKTVENFLLKMASLENIHKHNDIARDTHFVLSNFYRRNRDLQKTMLHLDKAYSYRPSYDLLKAKIVTLQSAGLYKEAIKVLGDTSQLETSFRKKLAMKLKQKDLDQLKLLLQNKIQQEQANRKLQDGHNNKG